jgi:hypothetical protein
MRRSSTDTCETHTSIQRYVTAAIIEARRVYFDQNWIAWAEHWIAGRDRSFASARAAHRIARQACDRESVAMASREHESLQNDDTSDDPLETPAAMAVWAAGLALITASIAPDPMAKIWRMKWRMNLVLGSRITQVRTVGGVSAQRPSLAGRAVALARRAAAMLSISEVPSAARLSSRSLARSGFAAQKHLR